jgi:4-methyl-5(b-hydroxyethyl)-thiazole monophosphate biosynthesis
MCFMVYVFIADGFEEVEAVVPVDILRRAGVSVKLVGVGGKNITGAHGIKIEADMTCDEPIGDFEAIMLPGGMPGTLNLEKSNVVLQVIDRAVKNGVIIAAICAAPSILGHLGLLHGKKAVCYPGFENDLEGAQVMSAQVCEDGSFITGNGPGAAFAFGLLLASRLCGERVDGVKSGMMIL